MTEADDAQRQLDQKGTLKKFLGRFTGSNEKLQSTINTNRAAAQYAAQQTLQKLAEQNLMTFDLISAVNNKLNASMYAVGEEFTKLYAGLGKFLKHNRSEMVRMETRLAKVEQNVKLLTWQNSIEYLEFNGEEYADMDDTKKIVCLVRDFYDITKGNWSTSDLLLLKTAMSTIDIQPKSQVNYFAVLKQIAYDDTLKNKLLGNGTLQSQPSPEDLMSLSVVKKLDSLQHEDAHVVDTMADLLEQQGVTADKQKICSNMTKNYLQQEADVNIDMDVDSYDMMLDLLYNLKQADAGKLLKLPQDNCIQTDKRDASDHTVEEQEDAEVQKQMGDCYYYGNGVEQNYKEAVKWYRKAAEQGDARAQNNLGLCYYYGHGIAKSYEDAMKWYCKALEQGSSKARHNLEVCYYYGHGIGQSYEVAMKRFYNEAK
ncbi:tetratricopeptide repeat protein [uncultured Megasphaera sp.]|uniref:tetratricopeptide repeat protein n=1 Tax=uncultured Megasphaera sp. TaxID=165188 RepID=UPI00265B5CC9|nr:tetratricopeptide repeat protein [uncultured Megasphaera sp.]